MVSINQPPSWQSDPHNPYIPIFYEEEMIGFCKPSYASRILEILNEEDRCRKALRIACEELVTRSQDSTDTADDLMQQYLAKTARPKRGASLIALLLKERQEDLDLSNEEFAKFCDSYRLSREELKNIYAGAEIESGQLTPLSRILGKSVDEIIEVWKGKDEGFA